MSLSRLLSRWRGLVLALIGVVATVWLGLSGQLGLYIHPRYYVFTLVMAVIAAVLVVAGFAVGDDEDDDGHGHDDELVPRRGRALWSAGGLAIVLAAGIALLVLPPATLSAASATQRDVNASAAVLTTADAPELTTGDSSGFTIKDWAQLLRSPASADQLAGRSATLLGFVTPDESDPENVFYVTRFVVTCCAVDAQPVGVPVLQPGWQDDLAVDDWVEVTGSFGQNPSVTGDSPTLVVPDTIAAAEQPAEPYVF